MSAAASVEFAGTDEELEKYLGEFSRRVGGWAARDPRRNEWRVAGGAVLSADPNSLPWTIRLARHRDALELRASGTAIPWLRKKGQRIATFRRGQLEDYLTTRVRGGGPEKHDPGRLRAPYSPYGSGVAALTASFAWSVASLLGALALALVAATIASTLLMNVSIDEIVERARILGEAGSIDLPSEPEAGSIGFGFRLGCGLLFAFPLAFFVGVLHWLALEVSAAAPRASWVPQWSFLTLVILLLLALWSFLPVTLIVPLAFLVPAAAHAGYTLPSALRRERLREETRPPRRMVFAGIALGVLALLVLVPRPASGSDFTDRLVLFRDRWLLESGPGKEIARFYYRYTLYTADPLKRFYSTEPDRPGRTLRTARVEDASAARLFRERDFTLVPKQVTGPVDVTWNGSVLASGGESVPWKGSPEGNRLSPALNELADGAFRGSWLRDVHGLAWYAVYFAGPGVCVVVLIGVFCPAVSLLFRKASRRVALAVLGVVFAVTVIVILVDSSRRASDLRALQELSGKPPRTVAESLVQGSLAVRQEAAFRLYLGARVGAKKQPPRRNLPAVTDALLRASDDDDLRVRMWAVAALGNTEDPRALPKLLERLEDPEFFVRYRAAEGLGFLKDARAVEKLLWMTRGGSWYEGSYALTALRKIAPGRF